MEALILFFTGALVGLVAGIALASAKERQVRNIGFMEGRAYEQNIKNV